MKENNTNSSLYTKNNIKEREN